MISNPSEHILFSFEEHSIKNPSALGKTYFQHHGLTVRNVTRKKMRSIIYIYIIELDIESVTTGELDSIIVIIVKVFTLHHHHLYMLLLLSLQVLMILKFLVLLILRGV